jgi:tetratricopeptide (TPR) repeat protein
VSDTAAIRQALESQRKAEQAFVERAQASERAPKGWPAALLMFHVGMWRERLRNALSDISEGRDYQRPPADTDEFNNAELPKGIGTPLADAASRSDHLLTELIELYEKLGERPIEWNVSRNTTEALLRNSYTHARLHMFEYYHENDLPQLANPLWEDAVEDMRTAKAPAIVMGTVLYNLACVRAQEGRGDDAIDLLKEAIPLRPDIMELAAGDSDLGEVREDPRFKELIQT